MFRQFLVGIFIGVPFVIIFFVFLLVIAMDDVPWLTQFYRDIAVTKKDITVCNAISNDYWKNWCYWHVGREKQDLEVCQQLANNDSIFADSCYRDIARLKQDQSICGQIDNEVNKGFCYDEVWVERAIDRKNDRLCVNIKDQGTRDSCYELLR